MVTRRERVILEMQDQFTSKAVRAAAAAKLLDDNLDSLSTHATKASRDITRTEKNTDHFAGTLGKLNSELGHTNTELEKLGSGSSGRGLPKLGSDADRTGRQIDRLSGRLALLAQAAAILGPTIIPLGAASLPAIAGLTGELGALAGALGVAILAGVGLGDGLKALNDYQLEPTQANLEKLRQEFDKLGPAGAQFVTFLDSIGPQMTALQDAARAGLFPGVEDGIESLLGILPKVKSIVVDIAGAMGELASETGADLAGPRFKDFFNYLDREAGPILLSLGRTIGNFAAGFTELLVEFAPLSTAFTDGLEDMSLAFADWSAGLDTNHGFQNFLDYLGDSGPKALDLLGSLVGMFASIAKAAAPVGDVVLPALTGLADIISTLADSPLGSMFFTAAAGLAVYSRATAVATAASERLGLSTLTGAARAERMSQLYRGAAAGIGMAVLAYTDFDDKLGISNTLMLGTAGIMGGPWGVAIGAAVGGLLDLKAANSDVTDELTQLNAAMASNNVDDLRVAMAGVRQEMEHSEGWTHGLAVTWDNVTGRTDKLSDALARAERRQQMLDDAAGRHEGLDSLLGIPLGLARQMDVATDSMDQFSASFKRLNNLLADKDTLIAYNRALDELAQKVKHSNPFEVDTERGRQGLEAMNALVQTAIDRSDKLKQAGKDLGAVHILDRAIADLQDFGKKSPEAKRAASDFIRELQRLNKTDATPKVDLDNKKFKINTEGTLKQLFKLDRFKAKPKVDTDTGQAKSKWEDLYGLGKNLDHLRVKPKADVDDRAALKKWKAQFAAGTALDRFTAKPKVDPDTAQALTELNAVQSALSRIVSKSITVTVNRAGAALNGLFDTGGWTGPGDRLEPRGIVHADEVVLPKDVVRRDASHIRSRYGFLPGVADLPGYADGGVVGRVKPQGTLEDQLAIAQIMQQIRDLRRQLAADGKNKLEGLDRRVAELQMKAAEKEMRLAEHREEREQRQEDRDKARELRQRLLDRKQALAAARGSLSFDSIAPVEQTAAMQAADEIANFRKEIRDAGGEWTKALRNWARDMVQTAKELDDTRATIAKETAERDALVDTLNDQQAQLDLLNSTMSAYAASVAANFLRDPFNGAHTETVDGVTDGPAARALAAAQAQLAAIRASAGGDSVMSAAQAATLITQIAELQKSADLEANPVEQKVSGLQALRTTLTTDTANADAMLAALSTLAAKGLDTTGALGGLYQQLAASGDVGTAQELANLSAEQIDEYEKLFKAREDSAAAVAAQATQAVYGEQQAQLEALVQATTDAITSLNAGLVILTAQEALLGEQVRVGAEQGIRLLQPQINALVFAIGSIADQQAEHKKKKKP